MVNIQTLVFLDLEATGLLSPVHKPKITELTMIAVHCSEFLQAHLGSNMPRIINKLTLCFNPKKAITPKAMEMTGLYSDSLQNQSDFDKDAVALIDVFLRRLAPPVCFLAHCGNRFDYPLLKTEILNVGSELTADVVCADTWEMFQSLDNRAYIPMAWSRKSVISHDIATANGVVSSKCDVVTLKQSDNLKKRHSWSSPKSDENPNSSNVSPSTSRGGNEDSQKIGSSKSETKSNIMNCKPNFFSGNTSLSLLCGGDLKSLSAKRVEHPDSRSAEASCACESHPLDCDETATRLGSTSPKVQCSSNNDSNSSRLCSPYAKGNVNNNAVISTKPATTLTSTSRSKISDTKGNGVRKITSFSIKDIVTSEKSDSLSGESSPPAIVSSGLTYRGSSPPALISSVNCKSPSPPTVTSLMRPGPAKSLDTEVAPVSDDNLDSVNNNSDKSSKDEMLLVKREKSVTKDVKASECGSAGALGQSTQNSAYVNSGTSENSVGSSSASGEKKVQIRKPAKKRFSRGHESLNFDSHDLNSKVESVKTDAPPNSKSPENVSLSVKTVPQVSSRVAEAVIASTSNSAADHQGRCRTPESNFISESRCPRSPTKRKPSDSKEHDSGVSQAKKVKKKLFESDNASVRELVRAASNSPGSDSGAEPVSSSQGNNGDVGNNKPRLESLGTIIYWHDYFNEEFFKESLEMEDCLHPKPDSSSSSREAALNMEKRHNSDIKRPQTLSVNVDSAVTVNSNPVVAEHSSAFKPKDSLAANPVLRSALTAPLNLSLKDRDELDVTSSHSNSSALAKSPEHDNRNSSQRLATTHKSHGDKCQNTDKSVDASPQTKVSYSQREIYRRVFGIYPPMSHRSEDDCITLMQIVQTVAPKAAIWLDVNSCPFRQVEPLYTRK